jgi:hypothetical protein
MYTVTAQYSGLHRRSPLVLQPTLLQLLLGTLAITMTVPTNNKKKNDSTLLRLVTLHHVILGTR